MRHRSHIDDPIRPDSSWKEILVAWISLIAVFGTIYGLVFLLSGTCPDSDSGTIGTSPAVIANGRRTAEQDGFENQADEAAALAGLDEEGLDTTAQLTPLPARPVAQHAQACALSVHPEIHGKPSG